MLHSRVGSCPSPQTIDLAGKAFNNRLGWKGFLGTNTLAYYENLQIMDKKCFITFAPGVNVTKTFLFVTNASGK
jgi:hypothetical protein